MRSTSRTAMSLAALAALTIGAAGCANDGTANSATTPTVTSSPSGSTSSSPTPSATNSPTVQPIEVEIKDGRIAPSPDRRVQVSKGQTVQITVTSDQADEVHVHGYDIEKPITAGEPLTIEFVADQAGAFEVEVHELDPGLLFTLLVE